MNRRVHLIISGHVQGVSYRWSAVEKARVLGLTGWVKNVPSGEVEAVVEGAAEPVERFIRWCRRGPPSAEVTGVQVDEAPATGEFPTFAMRR